MYSMLGMGFSFPPNQFILAMPNGERHAQKNKWKRTLYNAKICVMYLSSELGNLENHSVWSYLRKLNQFYFSRPWTGNSLFLFQLFFFFFWDLTNRRVSSQYNVVPKLTIMILVPTSIIDRIPYNFITYLHGFYNEMCQLDAFGPSP